MSTFNDLPEGAGEIAPLTQKGNFEGGPHLEDTRRKLIAKRARDGAKTPKGRRISNIVELIEFLPNPDDDQHAWYLGKLIANQAGGIA